MIPKYYEFYNPTKILSGDHAIEQIPFECMSFNIKRPAILTDNTIIKLGHIKLISDLLTDYELKAQLIIDDIPTDSSVELVNQYAKTFKEHNCDGVIAVGGGSVIDTAKAVNIIASKDIDNIVDVIGVNILTKNRLPLFAIPTTHGSGSEVTKIFVNSDRKNLVKREFVSDSIYPDIAIIDPRMFSTMPKRITALSAIDTLTQAIEAYTCLQKNPLSDVFSSTAIKLLFGNIDQALENDQQARIAMGTSALMAGIALSNSMVGMVHAISHAIGAVCHIDHGDCLAMILIPCMRYQQQQLQTMYSELLLYVGGIEAYTMTLKEDRANITILLIESLLKKLHEQTNLPIKLRDLQVKPEDFEQIAAIAINDGASITNPIAVTQECVLEILKNSY